MARSKSKPTPTAPTPDRTTYTTTPEDWGRDGVLKIDLFTDIPMNPPQTGVGHRIFVRGDKTFMVRYYAGANRKSHALAMYEYLANRTSTTRFNLTTAGFSDPR